MQAMQATQVRCTRCRDRGWVTDVQEDGEKIARRCDCAQSVGRQERLDHAQIPCRYANCSLRTFHTSANDAAQGQVLAEAKARCERYVEGFLDLDSGFSEGGLLFVGKPGSGKTHLAVAVLRELMLRYGVRGLFIDFGSLIERIQATFDVAAETTKHSLLRPVQEAEVVVLDELGVRKPTQFVSDVLYAVINERYKARLPTLFTTNYFPGRRRELESLDRGPDHGTPGAGLSLEHRIPEMLMSRLFEMTTLISMAGVADYRREIGSHRNAL